jgi:hypothetical protein
VTSSASRLRATRCAGRQVAGQRVEARVDTSGAKYSMTATRRRVARFAEDHEARSAGDRGARSVGRAAARSSSLLQFDGKALEFPDVQGPDM